MLTSYKTIGAYAREEYIIKRSKFIASAKYVEDEEAALDFLARIRREFHDATHNCYAYNVLQNGSPLWRFNDDGEPTGTAGMPILNVIQQRDLSNVIVVVTRYFGGILLGASGLVRAYSHSAALAVDAAGIIEMVPAKKVNISVTYDLFNNVQKLVDKFKSEILNITYDENINFILTVKNDCLDPFTKALRDISNGKAYFEIVEDTYKKA